MTSSGRFEASDFRRLDPAAAPGLDALNAAFWSELCGTSLARSIGVTGHSPDDLARFDAAYFALYPYLRRYLEWLEPQGNSVLEIGLGYGTVGSFLFASGADYRGLDISPPAVEMMRHRLRLARASDPEATVQLGSALALPHADSSFDAVVSIGCLHHTGNLAGGIEEVIRVLRPGGRFLLMVYNSHSFRRRVTIPVRRALTRARPEAVGADSVRVLYDADSQGSPAPHTDFVSRSELRTLLRGCRTVMIEPQNADPLTIGGHRLIARDHLLATLGRVLGLDLYAYGHR